MGVKIDLPVHSIEEASILLETIDQRIDTLKAASEMRHTTEEEKSTMTRKVIVLSDLKERLTGYGQG